MIEELLEALVEGSQPQQSRRAAPSSPWGGLLEEILGGGGSAPAPIQQDDGFGLDDIISGFIGGNSGMSAGSNPLIAPFAEMLSERLGISPQMAGMIISFALPLLMKQLAGGGREAVQPGGAGIDLDSLLDENFLEQSGAPRKLAEESGMDEKDAMSGILEALGILTGKDKAPEAAPRPSSSPRSNADSLEHLLDSWD